MLSTGGSRSTMPNVEDLLLSPKNPLILTSIKFSEVSEWSGEQNHISCSTQRWHFQWANLQFSTFWIMGHLGSESLSVRFRSRLPGEHPDILFHEYNRSPFANKSDDESTGSPVTLVSYCVDVVFLQSRITAMGNFWNYSVRARFVDPPCVVNNV